MRSWIALCGVLFWVTACGPKHVAPFEPRQRKYNPGEYAVERAEGKPSAGSIFSEAVPGFLQDARALHAGDILFVRIDEKTDASGDAKTKLNRELGRELSIDSMFGLVPAIREKHPDIDPAQLISLLSKADFAGEGKTSRKGQLSGSIAVRVREVTPNGDLFVEGTKVVMINNEENHLYISGLVRTTDIGPDNSIDSSRIADAQVEFTGRGDVADQVDRGWFIEILDAVNPF